MVCFHVLPDESIVACEKENKTYTLTKYNMNGHTLFKAELAPKTPRGMIEVTLIGYSFTICDRYIIPDYFSRITYALLVALIL